MNTRRGALSTNSCTCTSSGICDKLGGLSGRRPHLFRLVARIENLISALWNWLRSQKKLFHTTCWAPSDFNGSMKQKFFDLTWKFVFQLMISVSWVGYGRKKNCEQGRKNIFCKPGSDFFLQPLIKTFFDSSLVKKIWSKLAQKNFVNLLANFLG